MFKRVIKENHNVLQGDDGRPRTFRMLAPSYSVSQSVGCHPEVPARIFQMVVIECQKNV